MNLAVGNLEFPCDIIKKLKMKVNTNNLNIEFISGHIIKFEKTNLTIRDPHKNIVSNSKYTLIALQYEKDNKIYISHSNIIVSFTKFTKILNTMSKV